MEERPLVVLEAVGSETEGPFVCWQACPLTLATLKHQHRHTVGRYLHLRRLRQMDEHARRELADEGSGLVDPVVSAWQHSHPEAFLQPLSLSSDREPHDNAEWTQREKKEVMG